MYNNNVGNVIYLYKLYLRLLEINWCLMFFFFKRAFNCVHTLEIAYTAPALKIVLLEDGVLSLQFFIGFRSLKLLRTFFIEIILRIYIRIFYPNLNLYCLFIDHVR